MGERQELESVPGLRTLYGKAVAGSTVKPVLKRVPGIGGRFGGGERKLPERELVVRDVEVDREHLTRYDRVCGFTLKDELPPTYPHMLAFPLWLVSTVHFATAGTDATAPLARVAMIGGAAAVCALTGVRIEEHLWKTRSGAGQDRHRRDRRRSDGLVNGVVARSPGT